MILITVRCDNCGAPVQIGEETLFATCNHCSSQLAIEHTESATFTRRLADLESTTQKIGDQVELIRLQNELRQAESDWNEFREKTLNRGKSGNLMEPSKAAVHGARVFCAILIIAGIFMLTTDGEMLLHGLAAIVIGAFVLVGSKGSNNRVNRYRMTKNLHAQRMMDLRQQIEEARAKLSEARH